MMACKSYSEFASCINHNGEKVGVLASSVKQRKLISRLRKMDLEAIRSVWFAYTPQILRYVTLLIGNQNEAEEIVDIAFVKFIEAIHNGKGPNKNIKAYLYRIAYNEFVNYWKLKIVTSDLDESFIDQHSISPESEIVQQQERQLIYKLINQLTDEQKQVILLRFVEELTMKETAKIMGKSLNAIKAMQRRAVQRLIKEKELYFS